MRKILKILLRVFLSVVGLILIYLLTAFCLSRIAVAKETGTASDVTIYIQTNGVHVDIVVPVKNAHMDWTQQVKYSNTNANDTSMQWLAFGWGDRGFYLETPTWADLKASVALNAAFGLGRSAVHSTFHRTISESESSKRIDISHEQYQRLIKYLSDSFRKDQNGNFIPILTTANYSRFDAFYEATGRYNLFFTCNTWANSGLKASGQKSCLWTPFDTGIFYHYR